jgi:hypothetical protein
MNPVLAQDLAEVLGEPAETSQFAREQRLRSAARVLGHTPPGAITATTVVGALGGDDEAEFRALVARIADDCRLQAIVSIARGGFAVRFGHRGAR